MAKVLLLDGNSLVFRAFFAVPEDMASSAGVITNAVYGFTSMLVTLLRDHRPDGMAVAFDRPEPTFRHKMVDDYKGGRAETPDILIPQFGMVQDLLRALGIPVVEVIGYEADDVIATLAQRAAARRDEVIVVSGDRDTFQLVRDPYVKVLYNKRGVSDYELYDEAGIVARTGVTPSQYVTYAALRGDVSDNLPGVPGVGEKTAAKLVTAYGDMDGIYAHLDEQTPKLRENLAVHEDQARSNLEMMPLVTDLDLDLGKGDALVKLGRWDVGKLAAVLDELEFGGLRRRLADVIGVSEIASSGGSKDPARTRSTPDEPLGAVVIDLDSLEPVVPSGAKEAAAALREMAESVAVAVQPVWEGDAGRSPLTGVALVGVDPPGAASVLWLDGTLVATKTVAAALSALLSGTPRVVAHRAKEAMRSFIPWRIAMKSLAMDVAVAAYLLDPGEGQYLLDDLAQKYLGREATEHAPELSMEVDREPAGPAGVVRSTAGLLMLEPILRTRLDEEGMLDLYERVENPLIAVLARMEVAGIGVDVKRLESLNAELVAEVATLEREIQKLAGVEFKVNSTPQLRDVLYNRLKLAPSKKTKTGYSTDASSLERLRGEHPIIEKLLRYREVEKLRSTYGTGLIAEVDRDDGRIHASFNQTVARTGRLSSDRPNLHNIPVRTEDGRRFREAFVPAKGSTLLVADYDQIELRVIAHLSGDEGLREAFASHTDIHTATAARIFGVDPDDVTTAQRSKAKMVSYGLSYGMEAFGLASRLRIGVEEANVILAAFFESFPGVKTYMDATIDQAHACGYTETELGRRRPIPELQSSHRPVRLQGERQAMNAGIQGLAADIFKLALLALDAGIGGEGLASRVVLQVHDEVVLEVVKGEEAAAERLTRHAMEGAYSLRVPLEVSVSQGSTWAAAKG